MSTVLDARADQAQRTVAAAEFYRQSHRVRVIKIVYALLAGDCFWYAVPYHFPMARPTDLASAAANASAAYEGSTSRQIALPCIALIALYMLWRLPARGRFTGKLQVFALLYLGWALASLTWSQAPGTTGKRLIVLAVDALIAYTVARVFSVMEMALLGFMTTSAVAGISLYADAVYDRVFAPLDPSYRFMGVMEANFQAMNLVVCLLCALTLLERKPRWLPWIGPAVAAALALLYLTRSRVSTALCLVFVAVMAVRIARARFTPQGRAMVTVGVLALTVPLLILVVGHLGESAVTRAFMMGRADTENTASLSNRAPLWSELMQSAEQHPWLGFGYEAFWTPARVENISLDQGWPVPHAHNTYLDQMLSLGVVGTVLYMAALWGGCFVAWKRYRRERTAEGLLAALLLTWIALESLAESVPLDPYLPTLLAYACLAKMCMAEGSESESDQLRAPQEIVSGLPQAA